MKMISYRYRNSVIKFPVWFMNVLHTIMFSTHSEAYELLQTLNFMMQIEPERYLKLISLFAQGYGYNVMAAELDISRFSVRRRMDKICHMKGFDSVLKIRKMKKFSSLINTYVNGYEEIDNNMIFTINKLSELSMRELGVFLGILLGLSREKILNWVSIGDTKYREIKKFLSVVFDIEWLLGTRRHEERNYSFKEDDYMNKKRLSDFM